MSEKANEIDQESSQVVIQNYDGGEPIDAEELAAILEQAGGGDEGCAQIVDGDGNLITLTAEQLAQAGIDITNIGEADVETLLQLAGATGSTVTEVDVSDVQIDSKSPKKRTVDDMQHVSNVGETISKKYKLDTSMVHDQDGNDVEEELTELDEATLASLVQSGNVKFVDEAGNEISAATVLAGTQAASLSDLTSSPATSDERKSHSTKITRTSLISSPSSKGTNYALVGSEVEVKRGNRRVPATVRYVRHGIGYKVQFEDGRFEWVNENEVIISGNTSSFVGDSSSGAAGDHEYLIDDQDDEGLVENVSAVAQQNYKSSSGPPPILTPQMAPPTTKRPVNGVTGTSTVGRKPYQHSPASHIHQQDHRSNQTSSGSRNDGKNSSSGTNFVCPICETKVFNKEPSYIVIRLPACDECAESKILVLDENTK